MLNVFVLLAGAAAGALVAWRLARARAATALAQARQIMHHEIRQWQAVAARARAEKERVLSEAAAQLAGWRQGRADVISVMPYLRGTHDTRGGAGDPGRSSS